MQLNEWGAIVRDKWFKTAQIRPYVQLWEDEFVVMPNHIHGIIWIVDNNGIVADGDAAAGGNGGKTAPPNNVVPGSIGAIVRSFKSAVTKRINELRHTPGAAVWQRNYYERIIRDERALNAIRRYIQDNPRRWHMDRENARRIGSDPLAREIWQMFQDDDHHHTAKGAP